MQGSLLAAPPKFRVSTTSVSTLVKSILVNVSIIGPGPPLIALIDSGATDSYIDRGLVDRRQLLTIKLAHPITVTNFDGDPSASGVVTHKCIAPFTIEGHKFHNLEFLVLPLPTDTPIVLGYDFQEMAGAVVDFARRVIRFKGGTPSPEARLRVAATHEDIIEAPKRSEWPKEWLEADFEYIPPDLAKCLKLVPARYHAWIDVFFKANANTLPAHTKYNLKINLEPGAKPPFGGIYQLGTKEQDALKAHIDEFLDKGFMRESSSEAASPVLFVPKKDAELRPCNDYRALNNLTIKDRYPLPSTDMLLDQLSQAKVYTKLDLRSAYHQIRISEGDEWKTAIRTRYGLYEYLVMPFGLTNAPAAFQRMVNKVLRQFIDRFVIVYLDDILIYSATVAEHEGHVIKVLKVLGEHALYAKPEKCDFYCNSVEYLGFRVTPEGVTSDPAKIKTIKNWVAPSSVTQTRRFLGFANFYQRFVDNFSDRCAPLYDLLRKDKKFEWSEDCERAFQDLKARFTSHPILRHYDHRASTRVETDASDTGIAAVLMQQQKDDKLYHPVAYISCRLTDVETRYEVHDREMLAVKYATEVWRPLLLSCEGGFNVLTNNVSCKYFMTTKALNQRQVRWSEQLADFWFRLIYRPGKDNDQADALSRWDDEGLEGGKTSNLPEGARSFFQTHHLRLTTTQIHKPDLMMDKIKQAQHEDAEMMSKSGQKDPRYTIVDGLLLFKGRICVPNKDPLKLKILQSRHDHPTAGHQGIAKTLNLVCRDYKWPGLRDYVERYVSGCTTCLRSKAQRHAKYGNLMPLPVPERPWGSISMDSIKPLPTSMGQDSILVVVDRLTKMAIFIPTTSTLTAQGLARVMLEHVFSKHGTPSDIVSDRGPKFTSELWRTFSKALNIEQSLSTAFHPETDGQTERVNSVLEAYLRSYVAYDQQDWVDHLPLAEFAYNNAKHASTGMWPFFANKGFHPPLEIKVTSKARRQGVEVKKLAELYQHVWREMVKAQEAYKRFADRRQLPAPPYKPGDKVFLEMKNISTTQPSRKLAPKRTGPYTIAKVVNPNAMKLRLPDSFGPTHPTINVLRLEPAPVDTIPGRRQPLPTPW